MTLTDRTIGSALETRRQIADELARVETGSDPRTRFTTDEMRLMLRSLDADIAAYRKGLN